MRTRASWIRGGDTKTCQKTLTSWSQTTPTYRGMSMHVLLYVYVIYDKIARVSEKTTNEVCVAIFVWTSSPSVLVHHFLVAPNFPTYAGLTYSRNTKNSEERSSCSCCITLVNGKNLQELRLRVCWMCGRWSWDCDIYPMRTRGWLNDFQEEGVRKYLSCT